MGCRRWLPASASGCRMNAWSRRRVLWTLAAAPVALLNSRLLPLATTRGSSVGEVMRYLCEEIFPSVQQRRDELLNGPAFLELA
jgi:hypothetical protein